MSFSFFSLSITLSLTICFLFSMRSQLKKKLPEETDSKNMDLPLDLSFSKSQLYGSLRKGNSMAMSSVWATSKKVRFDPFQRINSSKIKNLVQKNKPTSPGNDIGLLLRNLQLHEADVPLNLSLPKLDRGFRQNRLEISCT